MPVSHARVAQTLNERHVWLERFDLLLDVRGDVETAGNVAKVLDALVNRLVGVGEIRLE